MKREKKYIVIPPVRNNCSSTNWSSTFIMVVLEVLPISKDSLVIWHSLVSGRFQIAKRVVQRKNWMTHCQNYVTGRDIMCTPNEPAV